MGNIEINVKVPVSITVKDFISLCADKSWTDVVILCHDKWISNTAAENVPACFMSEPVVSWRIYRDHLVLEISEKF